MRLALLMPMLVAASPAIADTLPLARGAYVTDGESCVSPANAFLRTYNGQGIGSSKAGQCRGRVLVRVGRRYTLRQDCMQYGDPNGRTPRATEIVKLRVDSRVHYTELTSRNGFRFCPGLRP